MWSNNNTDRVHYYRSYRRAPAKLVPSIISCQASCCLIVFGIFLFIAGCMFRFVAGNDSPPSKEFDNDFFNKDRSEFSRTPRTIGTIMMIIGGLLIGGAIIAIIVALVYYREYEKSRSETATNPTAHNTNNAAIIESTQLPIGGVHYPTQRSVGYENPPDYQIAAQSNTAYYPAPHPIKDNY